MRNKFMHIINIRSSTALVSKSDRGKVHKAQVSGLVYICINIKINMLLVSFTLCVTACTAAVYNVTPINYQRTYHKPGYYFNTIKYFVSNTQLHFLRGTHTLYTDLIIQNVENISLTGEVPAGLMMQSTIYCAKSSVNIILQYITNLKIQNIRFKNCQTTYYGFFDLHLHVPQWSTFIIIHDCYHVYMENVTLQHHYQYITYPKSAGLMIISVLGNSGLTNIWSNDLRLIYTDSNKTLTELDNKLTVSNYMAEYFYPELQNHKWVNNAKDSKALTAFSLVLKQNSYKITVKLINTTFLALDYNKIISVTSSSHESNVVLIENCNFLSNTQNSYTRGDIILIKQSVCKFNLAGNDVISIKHCSFTNNRRQGGILGIEWVLEDCLTHKQNKSKSEYSIQHCIFENNSALALIGLKSTAQTHIVFHIIKTQFMNFNGDGDKYDSPWPQPVVAIIAINVKIYFNNAVVFHNMIVKCGLLHTNEDIYISNNVTFSSITTSSLINGSLNHKINLVDDAQVYIINVSTSQNMFTLKNRPVVFYPLCYFQYQRTLPNNWTVSQKVIIVSKSINKIFDTSTVNINCEFQQDTMYHGLNPLKVYLQHTEIKNKDKLFNTGFLCYCYNMQPNCHTNTLGSVYPGQNLILHVSLNPEIIMNEVMPVAIKNSVPYESVCRVSSLLEAEQVAERTCKGISYTILSDGNTYCKLFLYSDYYLTVYFIKLLSCPVGFALSIESISKRCVCDPVLVINRITQTCNINDQTILRSANSWISATTDNNSYIYHVSFHCPFHYCLPHSSHLNFSTPNSQCQFNRSGLLCGHCQQGLSTVFSSSYCKACSNIYLLLIIPIIVIGFILVLLLFLLNLTVTDGAVNGFILYANIISINTPILFPKVNHFTPAYTFISLANLDLGIQTCFYNGMDDYAKMWLQLAFPFYLIFIATLIIITSRYSIRIQRLTARRALPVLATLFLLSYTKILRIVSSVLFFYSTITYLPSKHTTLVWSVDANVPLFGVRFTILFIMCLILFLILVPFNVILLFTRTLSRFHFINKFKPLLDAYQGPYKIRFYYWTGLQLLIRAVFFGTSSLDRNLNLTIGITLFSLIECIQGAVKPFKSQFKNFQEQIFLVNITILYAFLLYNQEAINTMAVNIMIAMAAIHFSLIIVYNIITYVCSAVIKKKMKSSIDAIIKRINILQRNSQIANQFELQDSIRCNIPEAVNYHEFREPLLNQT